MRFQERRFQVLLIFLGAVAVFLSLSSSLQNGFVNLDDPYILIENPVVKNFDLRGIFLQPNAGDYLPLAYFTYALEYFVFGLDPFVYHLDNLLLHLLNFLLVYFFFRRLAAGFGLALVSALLFALHPLRVESVAWVTERKDVLCLNFFMLSLHAYLSYVNRKSYGRWFYFSLSLIALSFALGAKSMAVTLPLILLLCDWFLGRRLSMAIVAEKLPFFIVMIPFALTTFSLLGSHGSTPFDFRGSIDSLVFYIVKSLLPFRLSAWYEKGVATLPLWNYAFATLVSVALIFFILRAKAVSSESRKIGIFGLSFFALTILPVLQIIPFGNNFAFADRYTYIPSIGLSLGLAVIATAVLNRLFSDAKVRVFGPLLSLVVLLLFAIVTFEQAKIWKNGVTLWKNVTSIYPQSAEAHFNLGFVLERAGEMDQAIHENQTALKLNPRHFGAQVNLGSEYFRKGDLLKAEEEYAKAMAIDPTSPEIHNNLGYVFLKLGRLKEAQERLEKAIELDPNYGQAHANLAQVYGLLKMEDKANEEAKRAADLGSGTKIYKGRARVVGQ